MQRNTVLLDAAIGVLADGGARSLTHRAVDARAGLPAGSTSNRFRSRDQLLVGVVQRVLERERAVLAAVRPEPANAEELADALADVVDIVAGQHRDTTLARQAVFAEAGIRPTVRAEIDRARDRLADWMVPALLRAGSTDVARHHRMLLALTDGLITHRIIAPDEDIDAAYAIRAMLTGLLGSVQAS
ncbi:TetR/AcrR family transcriptional regulator [Agromyces sp. NPDC058484]|uniref:TetR/AcrR family transcriptional regulator n=1 Tax=Agromyces sp. NPDC058484 TaxID=3346524 RepID=UPI00365216D9